MDSKIEELFKEVPSFIEDALYCSSEYKRAEDIAERVSDILMEFCGTEVAQLMGEYILAEMEMVDIINFYYFRQGYLAAKTRKSRRA